METTSLSYQTLKNTVYGFIGYAWPILFSVFITPVVVRGLGVETYGVYIFINTLTGFLVLADLGITVSLVKYIAEYWGKRDVVGLNRLLSSALTLYGIIGSIGFFVFFLVGRYFLEFFKIPVQNIAHVQQVFVLAGLVFFVNVVGSIYTVIPNALQRFDISTKINLVQLTVLNISVLLLVIRGYGLLEIFAVNLVTIVLLTLWYRYYYRVLLPEVSIGIGWHVDQIKKTCTFGILASLSNLASTALIQVDRFLIPSYVGTAQLSYYSLPGNVGQKTSGIINSLTTVLFPLSSSLMGSGEIEKMNSAYKRIFRNISVLAASITVAIIIFAHEILLYWLGATFADIGTPILRILAVTYYVLAIYGPLTNILLGMNKVKFLLYSSVGLAVVNIINLFIFLPKYGIIGAAWAYLIGVIPVLFIFYWSEKHIFRLQGMGMFYLKLYSKILCVSGVVFFSLYFFVRPFVANVGTLLFIGPLSIVFFLVIFFIFGFFDSEDVDMYKSFFITVYKKLG